MTSNNDIFGLINVYDQSLTTTPSVRIDPNISIPGIQFAPGGIGDENTVIRIVSDVNNGVSTFYICKGPVVLFSVQDIPSNGSNLYIQPTESPLASPKNIMVSDATGNVGMVDTLPITMGGTGMSTLSPSGTILGSNGVGMVPIAAGNGISIANGYISANGSPEFTNVSLNIARPIVGPILITPMGDAGIYPIEYAADSSKIHKVATIDVSLFSILTVRIISARKTLSSGGSANQLFHVIKGAPSNKGIKPFGSNASTGDKASVDLSINGNTLDLTVYLLSGDVWKGMVEFVSIT